MVKVIVSLESQNLWVDAIIWDGGATNWGMWKEFKTSGSVHNAKSSMQDPCPSPSTNAERTSPSTNTERRLFSFIQLCASGEVHMEQFTEQKILRIS